jgi:hypothetical protein
MTISAIRQLGKTNVTEAIKAATTVKKSPSQDKESPVFAHCFFFAPVRRITKKYDLLGSSCIFLRSSPIHMIAHANPVKPDYPHNVDLPTPNQFRRYLKCRVIAQLPETH